MAKLSKRALLFSNCMLIWLAIDRSAPCSSLFMSTSAVSVEVNKAPDSFDVLGGLRTEHVGASHDVRGSVHWTQPNSTLSVLNLVRSWVRANKAVHWLSRRTEASIKKSKRAEE